MPLATPSQPTAILVLGMHRSGTSVTTRVVNLLGADLGSHFLPPADDNPTGFWEHLSAYQIHDRLLTALGRNWYDMTEMPEGWLDHPAAIQAQGELEDLIREEFVGQPLWAIKDPRMCRLAPLWLRATANLGVNAKALFVLREPREVAESLKSRDGWLHGHSYVMWLQHFLEAEIATRGIPRSIISYESLLRDWQSCMHRVSTELGIEWPNAPEAVASGVAAYIDPSAHRHHSAPQLSSDPAVPTPPRLVSEVYQQGRLIEAGTADWRALQDGEDQYEKARDIFALPIAEQTGTAAKQLSDINIWRAEAESCGARLQRAMDEGSAQRVALERAQSQISQLTDRATTLDSQVEGLQKDLSELNSMLRQSEEGRQALTLQLEDLQQRNDSVQAAFAALQAHSRSRKWLLKRLLGLQRS